MSELTKRFEELSERAYRTGKVFYTDFLSMYELSELNENLYSYSYAGVDTFGGYDGAERKMVSFGDREYLSYADYPIKIIKASASGGERFAQALTHRDYLGALMNLGIDRKLTGDISVSGANAYICVCDHIADYICSSLVKVKNTCVSCEICDFGVFEVKKEEKTCFVPSHRIDCLVGEVYNLSRRESLEYFERELVFLDGKLCTSASKNIKENSIISVRGKGKFEVGEIRVTKKDRLAITVYKYV